MKRARILALRKSIYIYYFDMLVVFENKKRETMK